MAEHTSFFTTYRNQPGFQDELEISVFESYLASTLTVAEAAQAITAPSSDRRQAANAQVGKIWNLLKCGEEYPDAHEQVIELLQAILGLPTPEAKSSWDVDWKEERQGLSWTWRIAHDCKPSIFPFNISPSFVQKVAEDVADTTSSRKRYHNQIIQRKYLKSNPPTTLGQFPRAQCACGNCRHLGLEPLLGPLPHHLDAREENHRH